MLLKYYKYRDRYRDRFNKVSSAVRKFLKAVGATKT